MSRGYVAPEYALQGKLTSKADVFSYGIVLLELVSGRKNMNPKLQKDQQYLLSWVSSTSILLAKFSPWWSVNQSSVSVPPPLPGQSPKASSLKVSWTCLLWCLLGVGVAWGGSSAGIDWPWGKGDMWRDASCVVVENRSAVHPRCTWLAAQHATHHRNADKPDTRHGSAYKAIYPCNSELQCWKQQSQ